MVQVVVEQERKPIEKMLLRIVIESNEGDKVKINILLNLVKVAIDMGMDMPQILNNDSLKNIDFQQILDLVNQGVIGNLIDIESSDGDIVKIFVEYL